MCEYIYFVREKTYALNIFVTSEYFFSGDSSCFRNIIKIRLRINGIGNLILTTIFRAWLHKVLW